jgi:hypothetical protein
MQKHFAHVKDEEVADDEITISDLLFIEDDAAILDYCCPQTGLLLWPHIRIVVFRMILTDFLYPSASLETIYGPIPLARKLATLGRSLLWNAVFQKDKADVCIVASSGANEWVDNKWLNRQTSHFAKIDPARSLTLEDHFEWRWPFPRHDERVVLPAPRRVYHSFLGRLLMRPSHRRLARGLVDLVKERAFRKLGWTMSPARAAQLETELSRKIASLPMQYEAYRKLLGRIQPKVLLIGCASFGGFYATLIAAARSLGIPTAEYQHGAVSAGHDGYNFSNVLRQSEAFQRGFPDYFLSYGDWWGKQVNMPVETVVIGNPNRDIKLVRSKDVVRNNELLIFGDGMEFGIFVELAQAIEPTARKNGLEVVIRPHPLERSMVASQFGKKIGNIRIDDESDVFTSLRRSKILVSELSTGLFDAIGLTDRIYMWNTHKARFAFPVHPFESFSTAGELAALIDRPAIPSKLRAGDFWAPHWKKNYATFLARFGIPLGAS